MWTEIMKNDTAFLQKFYDVQKGINAWYRDNLTAEYIAEEYNRLENYDLKAFYYDDGVNELTIAVRLGSDGMLRLITTGVRKHTDIKAAVRIAHLKLIEIMKNYSKTECYALWSANNFALGDLYFQTFIAEAVNNGFKTSVNTEIKNQKYKLLLTI